MKSDREVNKQVNKENQTQEGGVKNGTSNAKNYTSRCTGLKLYKMFAALPEEEKGDLHATCFAPLLLIGPIATMSTLVMEIFDRHLGDMKFQFGETIIQMKPIHRNQIEAPAIGTPAVGDSAIGTPIIGSSSSATKIRAVVWETILYHLEILYSLSSTSSLLLKKLQNASEKEVKKCDKKDNNDNINAEENAKSEEEQPQVAEEEDSEPPTIVVYYNGKKDAMVVAEVAKTDIVFFNQEEVTGEAYQASADQTTVVSFEEQTLDVEKTEDEASQASADQTTVVSVEERTIEVAQTEVVISHQEEDVGEASQYIYLQSKESKEDVEQNKEEVVEGKDDDNGNSQNKPDPEQLIKEMDVDQTNA
ncbi:hypothetical protein GIB67_011823 [Kingdonia uniflora]|uniref:Uncharacterized protein n=1 Tax=Kingdonia uniflora TaxID=39325 RepID=A0A7J7NXJ6_9MAGN|nr:hypothetical protein GIB67_011823 [Kingdonia uniflora]